MGVQGPGATLGLKNCENKTSRKPRVKSKAIAPVNTNQPAPIKHHCINVTYTNADQLKNKMNELTEYIQHTETQSPTNYNCN